MRATTTINVPTNSPLYVAAVAYAREKKVPMSVAFREVALQAMRDRDAARKDVDDVTARLAGATDDLIGNMSTIRKLESEVARLTVAMKNLQAAYDDITARREAEAENHAKELAAHKLRTQDLRVTQVALDLLSDHVAALRTRNRDALDAGEV